MILSTHGIIGSSGGSGSGSPFLTNLYAVYKAESNANDSLGFYNGTAQGGLTYSTGKSGNAFTFNGTNAYVQLPVGTFTSFTSDFSLNVWVYYVNNSDIQTIFSSFSTDGVTQKGFSLFINTNVIRLAISSGSNPRVDLVSTTVLTNNTWYNIGVVRKGSTSSKIYINGVLDCQNTNSINPSYYTNAHPAIGILDYTNNYGGQYYPMGVNSKIDELNIWNKELTLTEVTTLYNSGTGKFYPTF
jgi:hypothetical protein